MTLNDRQWRPFDNPAREDGLLLSHWEKVSPSETTAVSGENQSMALDGSDGTTTVARNYSFAKYNTTTNVYSYSSDEYVSHLRDETGNWSREETDYLFSLCHKYDLRWFVIKDRWDFENYGKHDDEASAKVDDSKPASGVNGGSSTEGDRMDGEAEKKTEEHTTNSDVQTLAGTEVKGSSTEAPTPVLAAPAGPFAGPVASTSTSETAVQEQKEEKRERTIEEMKDRYYSVCRKLIRARPASDETAKQALLQSYGFDKGELAVVYTRPDDNRAERILTPPFWKRRP